MSSYQWRDLFYFLKLSSQVMIYCLIDFRIILQNRNFSKDPIKIGLTDRTERFFPLTGFLCQISVKLNHFFRGSPHHFMNIHSTFDAAKFHPHQKGTVSLTVGQSNIFLTALPHPTAGRNFMNTAILTMNRCKAGDLRRLLFSMDTSPVP